MSLFRVSLLAKVALLLLLVLLESGYGQNNRPDLMFMIKFKVAIPGCWCVTWVGHGLYYCMCPRYAFGAELPGGSQPIFVTPKPNAARTASTRPPTRPSTRALTAPPTRAPRPPPTQAPTRAPTQPPTRARTRPPIRPPTQAPTLSPPRPASPGLKCSGGYAQLEGHTLCLPTSSLYLDRCGLDKVAILREHNAFRAGVNPPATNMQKMYWDNELASLAQAWAEQCDIGHDRNRRILGRLIPPAQNFASGHDNMSLAILAFYNEVADFSYGIGSRNGGITGHYSQLVNDWSSRVGCGCAICDTIYKRHYVCNYLGPNWKPKTPYIRGSRCEDCPNRCVDGGLCDCGGKFCDNFEGVNLATCECN